MQRTSFLARFLILAAVLSLLTGCGSKKTTETKPAATDKVKLSGEQIDQVVRGNTLIMEEYGVEAEVELYANGSLRAFKQDIKDQTRGLWSVEEDKLCMKFKRWGESDTLCYEVYKTGNEYQQYASTGLMVSRFTVVAGVAHDPVAIKAKRQKGAAPAPPEKTAAPTDQPDVVAAEKSGPVIQESTLPSYNPETARRDLRAMYHEMSQNCPGCNLNNVNLADASLMRANLAGANLSNANLAGANLKWANLKGAMLTGANLANANLAGADLAGANLERADLTGANLTKTNLRGAVIEGAIGIDLKNAIR